MSKVAAADHRVSVIFAPRRGNLTLLVKQARVKRAEPGSFLCVFCLLEHVSVFISFDIKVDPIEMATAGSLVVRGIGLNSFFLTSESKGKRMKPAVIQTHQILTPRGYSNYTV